ncbi:MAG TPA: FkbM family methyltransferase [Candidatus Binataceae bacterium]|nr:FkbM family methyltransferase [Candidatus Binataceae bacterium]
MLRGSPRHSNRELRSTSNGTTGKKRFANAELVLFGKLKRFGYSPAVVYDIGASDGCWSTSTLPVFNGAAFHLFEPLGFSLPEYHEPLKHSLNAHPEFRLHQIALSSRTGKEDLFVFCDVRGSTLLDVPPGYYLENKVEVESWRLDDFVAAHHLRPPNVIKIDVQGFELEILKGGAETVSKADILVLETWLYRRYGPQMPVLGEIISFLSPLGFRLTDFGDNFVAERHILASVDAFFMNTRFLDQFKSASRGWDW